MVQKSQLIQTFAEAIATMEGFYKPNTLAAKNNNPGNLRSWGKVPVKGGYAAFPTAADGWAALRQQVDGNLFKRKLSIVEFFQGKAGVYPGYAPRADNNDPTGYAEFVRKFIFQRHPELTLLIPLSNSPVSGVHAMLAYYPFAPETK